MHPFVAVAGNIGTGKTGLAQNLASALNAEALLEDIGRNPYFDRFYESPSKWAFHSQTAFIGEALRRQSVVPASQPAVQDRTAYEAIDVFCQILHREGNLTDHDLVVLNGLRDVARSLPRQPTLLVYLHAPTEVIMDRIADRGRPAERRISSTYIDALNADYERFAQEWDLCPVLSIDTHRHDLREQEEFEAVLSRIRSVE